MMQEENNHTLLENQLIDAIHDSLSNHLYSNATFLAERLLAEKDNEESRGLLADCYMAENKYYKVTAILKDSKTDANRYKFALSCMKTNKFKDGEKALLGAQANKTPKNYDAIPNGSYGLYLLGVITEKDHRYNEAKDYFYRALEMNPTLWSAYEKLGKLGENVLPSRIFTDTKMKNYELSNKKSTTTPPTPSLTKRSTKQQAQLQSKGHTTGTSLIRRKNSVHNNQPSFTNLMSLLKKLAEGNYNLIMYNCLQAIQQFKKLPQNHFNTGWVLCNIGKAYMEVVRYQDAIQYYQQAYRLEPYRIQGVDYYSSCLWHLKKQVQLCNLAHQSLQKTLYAPQAWIAVGNCFSLQKQHQQALKFFTRAIQLSPNNPYALSLCGHQYVYNEDFPKAKKMFESALSYDVRHYNAWWGLGNIAYKQQKYDKAAQNFDKAIGINSKNPVLYSFMGITLAASRQFTKALTYFEKSEKLDPKNGLNRFQKANTLVKLERYDEAVRELDNMLTIMPKQPQIPMLLGKIYKKLNKIEKAHYYFSLALDLESKDAQKIKGFIESLHTGADNEEMEI